MRGRGSSGVCGGQLHRNEQGDAFGRLWDFALRSPSGASEDGRSVASVGALRAERCALFLADRGGQTTCSRYQRQPNVGFCF